MLRSRASCLDAKPIDDGAAGRRPVPPRRRHRCLRVINPVRFAAVESINATIKGVLRRGRVMRDEAMLLLKLNWATARPLRSARDVARFLHRETVHSNR